MFSLVHSCCLWDVHVLPGVFMFSLVHSCSPWDIHVLPGMFMLSLVRSCGPQTQRDTGPSPMLPYCFQSLSPILKHCNGSVFSFTQIVAIEANWSGLPCKFEQESVLNTCWGVTDFTQSYLLSPRLSAADRWAWRSADRRAERGPCRAGPWSRAASTWGWWLARGRSPASAGRSRPLQGRSACWPSGGVCKQVITIKW